MPYLLQGNAQQIFHAFGQDWAIAEQKDDRKIISRDIPGIPFLGTVQQAIRHFNIWCKQALGKHYLKGNMTAGNLAYLFGPNPLRQDREDLKQEEDPETYHANFVRQHFAYINDAGEDCGLMVMYRKDNPKQWVIGLERKGHAAPQDRDLICLSSFDLKPFIKSPDSGVTVSSVPSLEPLLQQIGSDLPRFLLQNAVNEENSINLRF